MWKLMVLTIHCSFWNVCDMDVVKELMTFDTKQQCEQAIADIHESQYSTLFCTESKDRSAE